MTQPGYAFSKICRPANVLVPMALTTPRFCRCHSRDGEGKMARLLDLQIDPTEAEFSAKGGRNGPDDWRLLVRKLAVYGRC